jgi:hypothetical protein
MNVKRILSIILFVFFISSLCNSAFAWFDETHMAIAKASGYNKWYYAVSADMLRVKAGDIEKYNHFYDNFNDVDVTPEIVLKQAELYDNPSDIEGHLYGSIIASLRQAESAFKNGKHEAEYHLAFCSHYIGDLSNPFHNMLYDDFNKQNHLTNDGIVDDEVMENLNKIKENMTQVKLSKESFEYDLATEIARIANNSRHLGDKLKKEKRDMTKKEAYKQLGQSASLLNAVLNYLGRNN